MCKTVLRKGLPAVALIMSFFLISPVPYDRRDIISPALKPALIKHEAYLTDEEESLIKESVKQNFLLLEKWHGVDTLRHSKHKTKK